MNKKALIITIVAAMLLLVPMLSDNVAAESSDPEIQIIKQGDHATLTIDILPGEAVIWDLGDGRITTGSSITKNWQPGFYSIKAAITSSSKETTILQKWIGFYDESAPSSVERNAEYRYCVFVGKETPTLVVKDSEGHTASWLTYDRDHRIVTGIPREAGSYYVWLNDEYFSINVTNAPLSQPWVRFNASVNEDIITATPKGSVQDSAARYSWSLSDLNGNLISGYEGKNLSLSADAGAYILKLQLIGPSGSATYSQLVGVEFISEPVTEETKISNWAIALGIIASILMILAIALRNEMIVLISLITAAATFLLVI